MTGIVIPGAPVPQGSKSARVVNAKGGGLRAQTYDDNSKTLKAWRAGALRSVREQLTGCEPIGRGRPVALRVRFVFPLRVEDQAAIRRYDKSDPVCGPQADIAGVRGAPSWGPCSPGCPHLPWHTVKPDKDKCLRALFDVLTQAGFWTDDGQCCRVEVLAYRAAEPMTMVEWAPLDTGH